MLAKLYTESEVCQMLCEACEYKLPSEHDSRSRTWYHQCNGNEIVCTASEFRVAIEKKKNPPIDAGQVH